MKRVTQTAFGRPDGNCFEACLASILELDLESIPRYTGEDWLERFNRWLRWHFSLQLITIGHYAPRFTYSIANGPNMRGRPHSVVMRGDQMVHDPNPDKGGLSAIDHVMVFVASNPARMRRRRGV